MNSFFSISVSAKGFDKRQDVIDFMYEILKLSPHHLEDLNFQFNDKQRRDIEKAIHGNFYVYPAFKILAIRYVYIILIAPSPSSSFAVKP